MRAALIKLWPYVGELFKADAIDQDMSGAGIAPDPSDLRAKFDEAVTRVFAESLLEVPQTDFAHHGGKTGFRHTEHLGHMLAQMQWMQRAYPGAQW